MMVGGSTMGGVLCNGSCPLRLARLEREDAVAVVKLLASDAGGFTATSAGGGVSFSVDTTLSLAEQHLTCWYSLMLSLSDLKKKIHCFGHSNLPFAGCDNACRHLDLLL